MAVKVRTKRLDPVLKQIVEVLKTYGAAHPKAEIDVYRHDSVSVRVRVIDLIFKGKSPAQREEELWKLIEQLPEEVSSELSLLLLFTPEEAKTSFASMEFDNPVPSRI